MSFITAIAICIGVNTPANTQDQCVWFEWSDAPRPSEVACEMHVQRLRDVQQFKDIIVEVARSADTELSDLNIETFCVSLDDWEQFQIDYNMPVEGESST